MVDEHQIERRRTLRRIVALGVVALCALPMTSNAGETVNRERSRALVERGDRASADGAHEKAIEHFQAALRAFDDPKIHVHIAEAHRARGQFAIAMRHYELFIARGTSKPRILRRINARISEIEPKIGRLELAGTMDGATVSIGEWGAPWREGRRIPVSAGRCRVVVARPGHPNYEDDLEIEAGQIASLSIDRLKTTMTTPPIDLTPRSPTSERITTEHTPPPRLTDNWWFWAGVGAAVVAVAGFSVLAATTGGDDRLPTGELPRTGTSDWNEL